MSVPPVRVSYSVPPPNLNVPPPNLNEPPPNMNMPLPNLNVPPPKLFVPPPNFKVPQPVPICTPPPYGSMSPPALPPMTIPPPIRPYPVAPIYKRSVPRPFNAAPNNYPNVNHTRPSTSKDFQDPFSSHSGRNGRSGRDSIDRLSRSCTSKRIQSPSHENKYETDVESERDKRYQEHRYSRSYNMRSRSLSNMSHRGRENSYRPRFDERRDYEQNRCEYERHSMSQIRDHGSHSRAESRESRRPLRTPRRMSKRSPTRDRLLSRTREWSHVSRHESLPKRKTEREKILEEYRLNYCKTSEVFIQKMEQWSKEHKSDEEETSNKWYRSSPAELYYKQVENGSGVQQTSKLEMICDVFLKELIERGRKARPEVDELPPLKPTKVSLGKDTEEVSTSSESDDECLEEEALEGYTDKIMQELQRKQSHPRRLHPEMYFNTTGENNGGRQCRCNASARSQGIQHGVYANEEAFPKCVPAQSNVDKLYHYRGVPVLRIVGAGRSRLG